ncbi:hypothetical protein JJB11_05755 [Ramlibacter ginsenosidimutans]|uniref:DUF4124 domain-containing protein n=1 Tax=Ramlibacter ginsenosidimutans TaxID=502333 RepID=A0A934TQB6_9BURK|nr:hypothetical protein [Ramlibacter ginsenosidimutans]MBK6005591.1 hypothetical protein [Ramlibacter ginsenosidimutans]
MWISQQLCRIAPQACAPKKNSRTRRAVARRRRNAEISCHDCAQLAASRAAARPTKKGLAVGLDDRDYMRERNRRTFDRLVKIRDRPFTPPPSSPSFLSMALTWICVAFVLFKAYGWWEQQKGQRTSTRSHATQNGEPPPELAQHREVHKAPAVAPRENFSSYDAPRPAEAARPLTGGTIYLCRGYSGGSFWASDHCNQHKPLIERIASVPAGLPFEQQVALAEQQHQAMAAPATGVTTTVVSAPAGLPDPALCTSLDARVNQLDAMARQPQSGSMQDWNRQERQKARDEQFRLHC